MVLGSHNSWTYLTPRKWYWRLLSFTAKCQDKPISGQYRAGATCFDLRVRTDKDGMLCVVHNNVEYSYSVGDILKDIEWLDGKGGCMVRVLHDVRSKARYTEESTKAFVDFCRKLSAYKNVRFFGGNNLYDGKVDYQFEGGYPGIEGAYASERKPNSLYAIFPRLYAKRYNGMELSRGTDKDVLLMDFV